MVLADVWVYPGENVFFWGQENHVFVYHEEPVCLRKGKTGSYDFAVILMTSFRVVSLFQARNRLVFDVISPNLLSIWK